MANVAVDVLLVLGVAGELLCCLGLVLVRNAYDRIHYAAAATTVPPLLILAAVLVRTHLTSGGLQAIAAVSFLVLANPMLVSATGRAARAVSRERVEASEAERRRATS
jgi:monovalent cation/proton antiporter MnhG/PhaG subunit